MEAVKRGIPSWLPVHPAEKTKGEGVTMPDNSGLDDFRQGVSLLRTGHSSEALEYLRRAAESKQQNPYYLSFLGVSLACAQGKWTEAVELCKTAINMKRNEAQLYMNLAEVYASAGRRDRAVETLDTALIYCKTDARITRMRGRLRKRRSPILPFLERGNLLNRSLGKLRHRVLKRLLKSED
jgi:tetratricopeptide (TPR) repeat protein